MRISMRESYHCPRLLLASSQQGKRGGKAELLFTSLPWQRCTILNTFTNTEKTSFIHFSFLTSNTRLADFQLVGIRNGTFRFPLAPRTIIHKLYA